MSPHPDRSPGSDLIVPYRGSRSGVEPVRGGAKTPDPALTAFGTASEMQGSSEVQIAHVSGVPRPVEVVMLVKSTKAARRGATWDGMENWGLDD